MKEKAKALRLQRRIKDWEARGGKNPASGHLHKCPGSRKKSG